MYNIVLEYAGLRLQDLLTRAELRLSWRIFQERSAPDMLPSILKNKALPSTANHWPIRI